MVTAAGGYCALFNSGRVIEMNENADVCLNTVFVHEKSTNRDSFDQIGCRHCALLFFIMTFFYSSFTEATLSQAFSFI